mgnify:FL=1
MANRFYVRVRICFANPAFEGTADVKQQRTNIQKDILNRFPEVTLLKCSDCIKVGGYSYQGEIYSCDVPREAVAKDPSFTMEWFF